MRYLLWIWHSTQGVRINLAIRVLSGMGQVVLGLLMVWLSKRFIDETIHTGTSEEVIKVILCLVAIVVCGILLRQFSFWLKTIAGIRQTNTLRLRYFSRLFHRHLYQNHEFHSGDITSRLSKDIETVSTTVTDSLPLMVITTAQLLGSFLLMRWFDAVLAWSLLLLTPMAIVLGKLISRYLRQMTLDIREDESRIQVQIQEGVEHNIVLRSLNSEQWVTARLDSIQQTLRGNVIKRARFTIITRFILGCVFGLGYLLAFIWGGLGLRNGTITFGVMTSFLQLVSMIQSPILQLLNMMPGIIHTTASIDRLEELSSEQKIQDSFSLSNTSRCPSSITPYISFLDVSFRYASGEREILHHFSHYFNPGSKTAIMGETGIGKTTLFRLILGFISPTNGEIDVKGNICFVPQGNTLMSGTIRYNLLLAKPDATEADMTNALHMACAEFVLGLPEGIDTELRERGNRLSEGQAQRIAIARGLLHGGDIFLFDEISSSLDEATEKELFNRIFVAYPQKTMLIITHRSAVGLLCNHTIEM